MADNMFLSPHPSTSAQLGLNIIDVIPDSNDQNEMPEYVGGGSNSEANCSVVSSLLSQNDPDIDQKNKAYVQIVEQPQAKALRFRYICEGRSAGSIPGIRSTPENKTYPTIKIVNYKGPAVVVVSCVTVDPPYRPHPHNLVGKEGCSKGVCTITIDNDSMECMFSNLGIQCVKKKDVEQALKLREEIRVDPFGTGFNHRNQPQSIDLNAVRLCFQVFLNSGKEGRFTFPLKPVVSEAIYDKKATSDLNICKLSDCTSCVSGGKEIILLCDKVTKEDIQIRFFEVKDGLIEWEAFGDFQASDVHKQVAISFKTPKYKDIEVDHSIKAYIQLLRPSDKSTSEPRPFEYLPMDADRYYNVNKRRKLFESNECSNMDYMDRIFPDGGRLRPVLGSGGPMEGQSSAVPRSMKMAARGSRLSDNVKIEPQESLSLSPSPEPRTRTGVKAPISPQHTGGGIMYQNISPLPPPHPSIQAHLQSPIYLTPSIPHTPLSIHSPHAGYYQVSPGGLPVDPSQSPFSPDNPAGAAAYPSPILLPSTVAGSSLDLMGATHITAYHPPFSTSSKPPVDACGALPDLGIINSSELNVDSVNNLSASLSCSLNLGDGNMSSLNPLDKKCSEDDKRSLNTPNSENFFANIPANSSEMRSEEAIPSSDSVKILKSQLEKLNKLSERS